MVYPLHGSSRICPDLLRPSRHRSHQLRNSRAYPVAHTARRWHGAVEPCRSNRTPRRRLRSSWCGGPVEVARHSGRMWSVSRIPPIWSAPCHHLEAPRASFKAFRLCGEKGVGGEVIFEHPIVLPLALVPVLWAIWSWHRTARHAALVLKALSLAAIFVALAQPTVNMPDTKTGAVVLVDTSGSITDDDLQHASTTVSDLSRHRGSNWMKVVP